MRVYSNKQRDGSVRTNVFLTEQEAACLGGSGTKVAFCEDPEGTWSLVRRPPDSPAARPRISGGGNLRKGEHVIALGGTDYPKWCPAPTGITELPAARLGNMAGFRLFPERIEPVPVRKLVMKSAPAWIKDPLSELRTAIDIVNQEAKRAGAQLYIDKSAALRFKIEG